MISYTPGDCGSRKFAQTHFSYYSHETCYCSIYKGEGIFKGNPSQEGSSHCKQGSSENDGRYDVIDRLEFMIIFKLRYIELLQKTIPVYLCTCILVYLYTLYLYTCIPVYLCTCIHGLEFILVIFY